VWSSCRIRSLMQHSPVTRQRRAGLDVPVGMPQLREAHRGADLGGAHAGAHVLLVGEEQQRHGALCLLWVVRMSASFLTSCAGIKVLRGSTCDAASQAASLALQEHPVRMRSRDKETLPASTFTRRTSTGARNGRALRAFSPLRSCAAPALPSTAPHSDAPRPQHATAPRAPCLAARGPSSRAQR